jgi:hypothetical protein
MHVAPFRAPERHLLEHLSLRHWNTGVSQFSGGDLKATIGGCAGQLPLQSGPTSVLLKTLYALQDFRDLT